MQDLINTNFLYDKGSGIEKGRTLQAESWQEEGEFCIRLKIDFNPLLLYWSPFNFPAVLSVKKICGAQIAGHNAYKVSDGLYYFILDDSFFYLRLEENATEILIVCDVEKLNISDQRELIRENAELYRNLEYRLSEAEKKVESLQNDLECITNSTIWKKTEPLRKWKDNKRNEKENLSSDDEFAREDTSKEIEKLLHSNIDTVRMKENLLIIEGWVICIEHGIREAKLILEDEYEIRHSYNIDLKSRCDVADAIGVNFIGDCGIDFCAVYESYSSQKILLGLNIDGKWYEIDTQKMIPSTTTDAGGMFYLEQYHGEEAPLDYLRFCEKNISSQEKSEYDISKWKADVIVPIYNGMQYLPTLFTGIEQTKVDYRLILVDDCSSDEQIYPYLDKYAQKDKRVLLLRNKENMGFVASVNRALKETEHHVVLINTDVELPKGWLERMLAPVYANEKVASVTPFSNSATIFSFPCFCEDNPLFMGLDVNAIDKVFKRLIPRNVEVPTGVGFCMTLNKNVLAQIGDFDQETFAKGYGEENDWCQRAIMAGYQNVCAENLFVYHNHGGSFDSEIKKQFIKENRVKLMHKYPEYGLDVEEFCRRDPNQDIRIYAKFELMFFSDVPVVLAFNHDMGGGADSYLDEKLSLEMNEGKMVAIVSFNKLSGCYKLRLRFGENEVQIIVHSRKEIMAILHKRSYEQIWINELSTFRELEQWLCDIVDLRKNNAKNLRMLIHDYFSICPSLNLVDTSCRYCGMPRDTEICARCLVDNKYIFNDECHDIVKWRQNFGKVLEICDEVFVFSEDSKKRMQTIYPILQNIRLVPHYVEPLPVVHKDDKTTDTINIGILGLISEHKGLSVLKGMIAYLEAHSDINMHLVLIGDTVEELCSPVLTTTGRYKREDIPQLTLENDVDIFFIPSVCPETFSYTTSEIMFMDMPIAVFDIGAPAERVKNYKKGLIISRVDIEELIQNLYQFAK